MRAFNESKIITWKKLFSVCWMNFKISGRAFVDAAVSMLSIRLSTSIMLSYGNGKVESLNIMYNN